MAAAVQLGVVPVRDLARFCFRGSRPVTGRRGKRASDPRIARASVVLCPSVICGRPHERAWTSEPPRATGPLAPQGGGREASGWLHGTVPCRGAVDPCRSLCAVRGSPTGRSGSRRLPLQVDHGSPLSALWSHASDACDDAGSRTRGSVVPPADSGSVASGHRLVRCRPPGHPYAWTLSAYLRRIVVGDQGAANQRGLA